MISLPMRYFADKMSNPASSTALILMLVGSLAIGAIVVESGGQIVLGGVFLAVLGVTLLTFYRLDLGYLLWIGLVMISDNYGIPGFTSITYSLKYLETLNVAFPGLGIGVLAPFELHMILILFAMFVIGAIKKDLRWEHVALPVVALLFFGWLIVSLVYGKSRGGDLQMGIWEIRALVFFGITFFLTPQIIKTREQLEGLVWVLIVVISFKAFQAVERFAELGFDFAGHRALANHEDPVFIVTLWILQLGLVFFGGNPKQRKTLLALMPLLVVAFYVANRRATYASLAACFVGFIVLLSQSERNRIKRGLLVFAVLFSVYLTVYWDSYGRMAQVAQAVKSTVFSDDRDKISGTDFASALARDHENYDLAVTLQKAPIMGIGFGNKHEWAIPAYGAYALKGYITHNQIMWLITKTGAIGFFFFLFFLDLVVFRGSIAVSTFKDPYLRAVAVVAILAIANQIVISYVDMQLTFYRNMVYLGTLTGLLPTLERLDSSATTSAG